MLGNSLTINFAVIHTEPLSHLGFTSISAHISECKIIKEKEQKTQT